MTLSTPFTTVLVAGVLLALATPTVAFGAGNIVGVSEIEGKNWRHGDIEDTLLQLAMVVGGSKFSKLDVKRVYFGNWLRDYSQAIDVGGLKQVPADTIRIMLWILSFMTFGFATGEFEVTKDRLGCYRPEEHIDNPKNYADNEDARQYDSRLRGPVDEGKELRIDPENGLKTYIASENAGCDTSAGLVRRLLEDSINLGRKYKHDKNKDDQYEALRKLGTALHCMEDYAAHSNYTELVLKELGVDPFLYVGGHTELDVHGKRVFPIVTGTFGMTDFLHSVVGEAGDKIAQSEVEELESQLDQATQDSKSKDQMSVLKTILDKIPWSMIESGDAPDTGKADELKRKSDEKAQQEEQQGSSRSFEVGGVSLEDAKQMAGQTATDIYPILEWHDKILKAVTKVISIVPGLDDLLEDLTGALTVFIFSLLAPYVKPIISQARAELKSSSEGVLKSSVKEQYAVFDDENCSDPTHSMLSKDHFSNILNPVAGQIASATVKFVVPLVVEAWNDDGRDTRGVIDEVLQIFHHPALRDENKAGQRAMFEVVKKWWEGLDESTKQDYKQRLGRDGVRNGKNHRGEGAEGGHGHGGHQRTETQINAESTITGLAGGLMSMVLGNSSGPAATTQNPQAEQSYENRRHDEDQPSYGAPSSQQQQQQQQSYGHSEETPSYGGRPQQSGYGGNDDTPSYQRPQESSYERPQESNYGRPQESSYGEQQGYGQQQQQQQGYGQEQQGYGQHGGQQQGGYGQQEQQGYGRPERHEHQRPQESSYGGGDGESGGFPGAGSMGDHRQDGDFPGAGSSGDYRQEEGEQRHHGGQHNEENEGGGYGRGGEDEGEGEGRRHHRRDEGEGYGR